MIAIVRKKTHQEFVNEVNALESDSYIILGSYCTAKIKIEMKHVHCGFEYKVAPDEFTSGGKRCPKCFGTPRKTQDEFSLEIRLLVGQEYEFLEEYRTAKTKIKVIHNPCGFIYSVTPTNFKKGKRCPKCVSSKGEQAVMDFLERNKIDYLREYKIKSSKLISPLRFDFFVEGIAIEYDGRQHYEPVEIFGGQSDFIETQRRDRLKNEYCEDNGIPLIRIPYWDYDRIDEILTDKLLPLLS